MARYKNGTILELDIFGLYFCYAQILPYGNTAFFDFRSEKHISDFSILDKAPILFIINIYPYIVSKGLWKRVGYLNLRENFKEDIKYYIYDEIHNKYEEYSSKTGEIKPSSLDKCKNLECCAVWDKNHVEDRIRDYYSGKTCIWLKQLSPSSD